MRELPRINVSDLFAEEREALLDAMSTFTSSDWDVPTSCPGWSVKDIAAHLVADDLGVISRQRDGHRESFIETRSFQDLVDAINKSNEEWVRVMRRLSPPVILDLLRMSGPQLAAYMSTLDLHAVGNPVDWAGPEPAPVWLDVAREYTERWLHGAQILEAASRPLLTSPRLFAPVLATFARSLPRAYSSTEAPDGTHVCLTVEGDAGGSWSVVREGGRWRLAADVGDAPSATVILDGDTAWRMYTRGLAPEGVRRRARIDGDEALGAVALTAVAILA